MKELKWKAVKVGNPGGNFAKQGYEIHFGENGECVTDFVYEKEDAELIEKAPQMLNIL